MAKYYFQYGAPGTEFKVHADGVYVSDSPLGPFVYQKHNPMCYSRAVMCKVPVMEARSAT